MNTDRKIIIGQLDTGEWCAAATASPYFCVTADTEEEVLKLVDEAAEFYANAPPRKPVRARSQTVTHLTPFKVIKADQFGEQRVLSKAS